MLLIRGIYVGWPFNFPSRTQNTDQKRGTNPTNEIKNNNTATDYLTPNTSRYRSFTATMGNNHSFFISNGFNSLFGLP